MSFPKGDNASPASFTCCNANGIPIIVIPSKNAKIKCEIAIQIPPVNIQAILNRIYKQPLLLLCDTIVPPNGHNTNWAILKHCNPKGMPRMVKHNSSPPIK